MKNTKYNVIPGNNPYNIYQLTARTDNGARKQAKKLAAEKNWNDYSICFFRESDGCRGFIDN